jgi:hypothetical protein
MQETKNVTYEGTLQAAGASIFMEGTHKLQLEDGRFIMLESTDVDLNQYIGQKVELFGAVRPTVEAGGMIMRVERIASREPSSSSMTSSSSIMSGSESSSLGEVVTSIGVVQNSSIGICSLRIRGKNTSVILNFTQCATYNGKTIEATGTMQTGQGEGGSNTIMNITSFHEILTASSEASDMLKSSSSVSIAPVQSSSTAQSVAAASSVSSAAFQSSNELTENAAVMAKDKMDPSLWTQQYCTKTAAYCVSIHKNWYFKSFGATSATLWYVEVGPQEINNIGEGPLTINLLSGTAASAGGTDGQVQSQNGAVIGYKEWTEGRHFEIRGPANLQAAITYMLGTLKPYAAQ